MAISSVSRIINRKRSIRIAYAWMATVGYILSPLSWWNDLVVNIPIAILATNLIYGVTGINRELLFVVSYWLTNIIGMMLMFLGGEGAIKGRITVRSFILSVIVSLIYTIIVVKLLF